MHRQSHHSSQPGNRQLSKEKQLSLEKMEEIMCEVKKGVISKSGIHKRAVAQVFSKFLYTGNDETGNTGTVEIIEKRIMG